MAVKPQPHDFHSSGATVKTADSSRSGRSSGSSFSSSESGGRPSAGGRRLPSNRSSNSSGGSGGSSKRREKPSPSPKSSAVNGGFPDFDFADPGFGSTDAFPDSPFGDSSPFDDTAQPQQQQEEEAAAEPTSSPGKRSSRRRAAGGGRAPRHKSGTELDFHMEQNKDDSGNHAGGGAPLPPRRLPRHHSTSGISLDGALNKMPASSDHNTGGGGTGSTCDESRESRRSRSTRSSHATAPAASSSGAARPRRRTGRRGSVGASSTLNRSVSSRFSADDGGAGADFGYGDSTPDSGQAGFTADFGDGGAGTSSPTKNPRGAGAPRKRTVRRSSLGVDNIIQDIKSGGGSSDAFAPSSSNDAASPATKRQIGSSSGAGIGNQVVVPMGLQPDKLKDTSKPRRGLRGSMFGNLGASMSSNLGNSVSDFGKLDESTASAATKMTSPPQRTKSSDGMPVMTGDRSRRTGGGLLERVSGKGSSSSSGRRR